MPAFVPDIPYHIQAVFVFTFSYIYCRAFTIDPDYLEDTPTQYNLWHEVVKKGVWQSILSTCLFMTSFAYLNPYLETFQNPWLQRFCRCVLACWLMYHCFLICLLNQRPDVGRAALGFLDSRLGQKVEKGMHTYDNDCDLTLGRLWEDMDHYFIAHWCDYFGMALILRDPLFCHFWSIFYEIIELSAQHRLPHFAECWWDHIITDFLLSNTPAIIAGTWLIDRLGIRRYDWFGRFGKERIEDWEVFKCHRRWGNICIILIFFSAHFLCTFFLMNALLVPPTHPWVASRMLLWAFAGGLIFREIYMDIETWNTIARKTQPIEGRYRWLAIGTILTESLIAYKYRNGTGHITDTPTPLYISIPWIGGSLALLYGFLHLRFKPGHTTKFPGIEDEKNRPLSPRRQRSLSPRKRGDSPKK